MHGVNISKKFEPDQKEFTELYEATKSSRTLAKHYHVSHKTILSYAHKLGIDTSYQPILSENDIADIISKYNLVSSSVLAKQYGCSSSRISQIWMKAWLKGKETRMYTLGKPDYFSCIDSPAKAYFLGFISADGCIHHPKQKKQDIIRITIHVKDVKILELFKSAIQTDKPIHTIKQYASLEISSQQMSNDLKSLGLSYQKTYNNSIAIVSKELMPHFIRGYLDGDGSITNQRNKSLSDIRVSFSGYKSNMDQLQNYLSSMNILTEFIQDKRCYTNGDINPFGALTFTNRLNKYSFLKLIYSNCDNLYLDRKYQIAQDFLQYIEHSSNIRDRQIIIYYQYAVRSLC